MDAEKLAISTTTDGRPPAPGMENAGAPQPIDPKTGQHGAYWILSEVERARGFVRPVRFKYVHVGTRPKHPLRELTEEERIRYRANGYVKYEEYPEGDVLAGRYWTNEQLSNGCGAETRMSSDIAETWARDVHYYIRTMCIRCKNHFPVNEFVWEGTNEVLGT